MRTHFRYLAYSIPLFILFAFMACVQGAQVNVDAKADLFDAGDHFSSHDGILPIEIQLPMIDGPRYVEFASITGQVNAGGGWPWVGADGGTYNDSNGICLGSNIFSNGGISGIRADRFQFLAGVFLDNTSPVPGNEPPRLDFRSSQIGIDFLEIEPSIAQMFFIGDGRASNNNYQKFHVPAGATRLFLGYADAGNFGYPNGAGPSWYFDNQGSFSVEYQVVPEPSIFVLCMIGVLGLLVYVACHRPLARVTNA